jgi:hypothetical protein
MQRLHRQTIYNGRTPKKDYGSDWVDRDRLGLPARVRIEFVLAGESTPEKEPELGEQWGLQCSE